MEELKQLAKEKKKYQEKAKNILKGCLQDFMKAHPNVKAISWVQYTPYFNDGEECTFSMHDPTFCTKEITLEEMEDTYTYDEPWFDVGGSYDRFGKNSGLSIKDWEDCSELKSTLASFEEEMKFLFGDHVRVIVTPEGVHTYEYEHD